MMNEPDQDILYQLHLLRNRASLKTALDAITSALLDPEDTLSSTTPIFIQIQAKTKVDIPIISTIEILIPSLHEIYIIDVLILGADAFKATSAGGISLEMIFESDAIPKVFFDARRNYTTVFHNQHELYDIHLYARNIHEIQVMELATRPDDDIKDRLADLDSLIEEQALVVPKLKCDGCTQMMNFDVRLLALPQLYEIYSSRLVGETGRFWILKMQDATTKRIRGEPYGGMQSPWRMVEADTRHNIVALIKGIGNRNYLV